LVDRARPAGAELDCLGVNETLAINGVPIDWLVIPGACQVSLCYRPAADAPDPFGFLEM